MDDETVTGVNGKKRTAFDVEIETENGNSLIVFKDIIAQTKGEAINKVKQKLVFTAEKSR